MTPAIRIDARSDGIACEPGPKGESRGRAAASPDEARRSLIYEALILNLTGNLKGGNA